MQYPVLPDLVRETRNRQWKLAQKKQPGLFLFILFLNSQIQTT